MSPVLILLSREVRRVPLDWQHPRDERGHFQPMHDRSFADELADYEREREAWQRGEFPEFASEESRKLTYEEWSGDGPDPAYYMPTFPPDAELGLCMYETVTEGTPISAVYPDSPAGRRAMAHELSRPRGAITDGMSAADWMRVIDGEPMAKDIHSGEVSGLGAVS